MKRITHIITGLNVGGAERALNNLLTGGLRDRFENRVISLMDEGAYGRVLRDEGIDVTCLYMARGHFSPIAAVQLLRIVKAHQPAIVQGWMYHGNLAASFARRFSAPNAALSWNIRTSLEGAHETAYSAKAMLQLSLPLSKGADAIIYNSYKSRQQHESVGYAALSGTLIPNGFDTAHWKPNPSAKASLARALGLSSDCKIIGFVGRACAQKDLPTLFEAFQHIYEAHPDCHLVCVGRDIYSAVPESLDRSRVSLLGQRSDIDQIMPGLDLLCLSSSTEGFPNVIGEAMACGVPCVTTDAGDAGNIVEKTGWVVPTRNPAALAEALSNALNLSTLERGQLGNAGRARIKANFSLHAVIEQYATLYGSISPK